jgi:hypothetical protein
VQVQQQVAVEDDEVPRQHRDREVEPAQAGDHVPQAIGSSEVGDDEQQAHDDRGDRKQLADDHDVMHQPIAVEVGGDDHHHATRRHADEEREVGDVQAPAHVIGHVRQDHAVHDLVRPGVGADERHRRQHRHPRVEEQVAVGRQHERPPEEPRIAHEVAAVLVLVDWQSGHVYASK